MINQDHKCPLCQSILTRGKWVKITGQWEERQKLLDSTKKEIEKYKKEQLELKKKYKNDLKNAMKSAKIAGVTEGIKKEKSERERMNKMLQNQAKAIEMGHKKIQELQKQLKEGKTPQIAGFDYEKEVQKMLSESFPEDKIKPTGKMGDVIHIVIFNSNEIGSILFECKKTEKYNNGFIKEIKRHQETARTDYAVVITHAQKENKSKFFIDDGVIVIDPLGLLDIAFLLRNMLIDVHKMKLTKEEVKEKGMQILRYMQSGEFRSSMVDTIEKSRKAYELLTKEINDHRKVWIERIKIYATIHENTQNIRKSIGKIITGGPVELEDYPFIQIEPSKDPRLEDGE
jgi:hypothetical protein